MNAWVVRSGRMTAPDVSHLFESNSVAAISFGHTFGDMSGHTTPDQIRRAGEASSNVARIVHDFVNQIQVGDLIIASPTKRRGHILIGRCQGDYEYSPGVIQVDGHHYNHIRKVDWLAQIPWSRFDGEEMEVLRNGALNARATVSDATKHMDAIEALLRENEQQPEKKKIDEQIEVLESLRQSAHQGGGQDRIDQQHSRGKLTARERLALLMDEGTFQELDPFVTHRITDFGLADRKVLGDAVVTGYGKVEGRQVFAFAQDFTVMGGSLSEAVSQKICKVMDLAAKAGCPMIGLNDSGGARIQEGALSLAAYGDIFLRNTLYSGVVPQISVIVGPSAGGAVYSPAITDFIFMVKGTGQMYITGPDVIKAVTGEEVTHEELGGAEPHATRSGVAHFVCETEEECITDVRHLLSFLPGNNVDDPPLESSGDVPDRRVPDLRYIVPGDSNLPYDIRDVIYQVVDQEEFMEVHQTFAPNVVVGFARLDGKPVGVIGNQPAYLAGVLDIDASAKAARFVRFCDCFNIPLVTFVDVPGFMPGVDQEYGGIIRHGSKLIFAFAEATVPKIAVITRKAYGGAYIVMSSKHLRSDINLAWPSAEIAVMGADGAVNIIYRDEIRRSENPEQTRRELVNDYKEKFTTPYIAASRGYLDDVIDPADTRVELIKALEMLQNKRDTLPVKKHGNIPL